jgi:hypothetical protein
MLVPPMSASLIDAMMLSISFGNVSMPIYDRRLHWVTSKTKIAASSDEKIKKLPMEWPAQ